MAFQQLTLSQVSLAKTPSGITEMYIPLWVYSYYYASVSSTTKSLLQKGTTSVTTTTSGTAVQLHTLNPNWSPAQQFALEVSLSAQSGSTAFAQLYDITAGSVVTNSQVSTTATLPTVIRSPQITLVPGHIYGVYIWNSTTYTTYLDKAHLVAFL